MSVRHMFLMNNYDWKSFEKVNRLRLIVNNNIIIFKFIVYKRTIVFLNSSNFVDRKQCTHI